MSRIYVLEACHDNDGGIFDNMESAKREFANDENAYLVEDISVRELNAETHEYLEVEHWRQCKTCSEWFDYLTPENNARGYSDYCLNHWKAAEAPPVKKSLPEILAKIRKMYGEE